MTSFAILIALALEFLLPDVGRYRPSEWLEAMIRWMRGRFRDSAFWLGWPGVLVTLAVAPAIVGVVADALDDSGGFMQALLLLFSAVVLVFCLRARELWEPVRAYLRLGSAADEACRRARMREILGHEPEGDADRWPDQIMVVLLSQATERLFGPLFWFVVLGPVGAALFYVAGLLKDEVGGVDGRAGALPAAGGVEPHGDEAFAQAAQTAYRILAAVPLRLLVMAYSLVGSFTDTLEGWRAYEFRCLGLVEDDQGALAVCAGFGALSMHVPGSRPEDAPMPGMAEVEAVLRLQQRALMVWVAAVVVLWMVGVLS